MKRQAVILWITFIASAGLGSPLLKEAQTQIQKLGFSESFKWFEQHHAKTLNWDELQGELQRKKLKILDRGGKPESFYEHDYEGSYFLSHPTFKKDYLFVWYVGGTMRNHSLDCFVAQRGSAQYKRKFTFHENTSLLFWKNYPLFVVRSFYEGRQEWRLLKLKNSYLHDVQYFSYRDDRPYKIVSISNAKLIKALGVDNLWKNPRELELLSDAAPQELANPHWRKLEVKKSQTRSELFYHVPKDPAWRDEILVVQDFWENMGGSLPTYTTSHFFDAKAQKFLEFTSNMWQWNYISLHKHNNTTYLVQLMENRGLNNKNYEVIVRTLEQPQPIASYKVEKSPKLKQVSGYKMGS